MRKHKKSEFYVLTKLMTDFYLALCIPLSPPGYALLICFIMILMRTYAARDRHMYESKTKFVLKFSESGLHLLLHLCLILFYFNTFKGG
jgi:ABC-type iron transport system FetAB permease component